MQTSDIWWLMYVDVFVSKKGAEFPQRPDFICDVTNA